MTSAIDELRRLLDERGVEYDVRDGKAIKNTYWDDVEGRRWGYASDENSAVEDRQLFLVHGRMDITPEQAIAATLGNDGVERSNDGVAERGTCRMERANWDDGTCTWGCICSACGKKFEHETGRGWHYCPKCGVEVVE